MININELGFNKEAMEVIGILEEDFKTLSIKEGREVKLIDWINSNINNVEKDFFKGWTDREKFLYVIGILSGALKERGRI